MVWTCGGQGTERSGDVYRVASWTRHGGAASLREGSRLLRVEEKFNKNFQKICRVLKKTCVWANFHLLVRPLPVALIGIFESGEWWRDGFIFLPQSIRFFCSHIRGGSSSLGLPAYLPAPGCVLTGAFRV